MIREEMAGPLSCLLFHRLRINLTNKQTNKFRILQALGHGLTGERSEWTLEEEIHLNLYQTQVFPSKASIFTH